MPKQVIATVNAFLGSKSHRTFHDQDDLWRWLVEEAFHGLNGWTERSEQLYFRGQADSSYGLTSSLYRECRRQMPDRIEESDLLAAEMEVIARMRHEGVGRRMTDGQLLMVLQHHGIPTRLIDASKDPFVALFFAVEKHHGKPGRMFFINPHNGLLALHRGQELPWYDYVRGLRQSKENWSVRVHVVDHKSLDPRMHAQDGVFLVGGLSRRYGGQRWPRGVEELVPDVSNLNLNFLTSVTAQPNPRWGGTAWTIEIPAAWKSALLKRLADEKQIAPDTMYPPLGEVSRLARYSIERLLSERLRSDEFAA